jgi:hypothetical protein
LYASLKLVYLILLISFAVRKLFEK